MVKNKALSKVVRSKREKEHRENEELTLIHQKKHEDFIRERKLNTSIVNRTLAGGMLMEKMICRVLGHDIGLSSSEYVKHKIRILNSYTTGMYIRTDRRVKFIKAIISNVEYTQSPILMKLCFDVRNIVNHLDDNEEFYGDDMKHLRLLAYKLPNMFHYLDDHYRRNVTLYDVCKALHLSEDITEKIPSPEQIRDILLLEIENILSDFLQMRLNYKKNIMSETDIILLDHGLFDNPSLSVEERKVLIELMDLRYGEHFIKRATVMSYSIVGFWEYSPSQYKTIKL